MKNVITKLLGISEVSYYRWKKERMIIDLLEKYFTENELKEFIENNKITKLELIKDLSTEEIKDILNNKEKIDFMPFLEDYIIINLKRFHKLDRKKIFNFFFPTSEFITRNLKKIESIINLDDLDIYNARDKFKTFIKHAELKILIDTEMKRNNILKEIDQDFSDIELYVILKHRNKFI